MGKVRVSVYIHVAPENWKEVKQVHEEIVGLAADSILTRCIQRVSTGR